eukprot:SAG31_NODE_825_length_11760_cov_5.637767_10_plen_73_part_00
MFANSCAHLASSLRENTNLNTALRAALLSATRFKPPRSLEQNLSAASSRDAHLMHMPRSGGDGYKNDSYWQP